MTIFLGIILTFVVFTAIVFIHELGHFLTARITGMKVEEFGIGIPPKAKILGKDKKGTEYTLNWLPIGGFVRIKGEDPGSKESRSKDAFSSKKWWARSLVLVAGVTMNFLLALVVFMGLFLTESSPLIPNVITEKNYGSYFLPSISESIDSGYITYSGIVLTPLTGGLAEKQGILTGDMLVSIDGKKVTTITEVINAIQTGVPMKWIVSTMTGEKSLIITPENGKIQTYLGYNNLKINPEYKKSFSPVEAVKSSMHETYTLSLMTFDLLGTTLRKLIYPANEREKTEAREAVAGPIGMGAGFVSLVENGINIQILGIIIALLSINLGVLNILPFPALDGGRLVSTSIRSIVGIFSHKTRLLDTVEYFFHAFGMVFLLSLSLVVAFIDVSRFF